MNRGQKPLPYSQGILTFSFPPHPPLSVDRTFFIVPDQQPSDDALLSSLAAGDLGALAALYDRYGRLAYSLAYRILGEGEAAEDVVQDAFLSAWRGAGSYRRERGNPRAWLLSIVHHRAVDILRRKTTFRPAPLEMAESQASDDDTALAAEKNVEHRTVRDALQALPQAQRRTIELAYFGGATPPERPPPSGPPPR